jgi:hypothetical protein
MIKYFKYGDVYVKYDQIAELLTKVINTEAQKAITTYNRVGLHQPSLEGLSSWQESDEQTFNSIRTQVLTYLNLV